MNIRSHPYKLALVLHAVRQVEIDELLIGDARLFRLGLEVIHRLNGPLDGCLALAGAMDELYPLCLLLRVQLLADLLQMANGDDFGQAALYSGIRQQPGQLLRHLRVQLFPLFLILNPF